MVCNGTVVTPALDHQILPGVTRRQCLELLEAHSDWPVEIRPVSRQEVEQAEEIWLSSSTKELAPIVKLDGKAVGDGKPGRKWALAQKLFHEYRFSAN